MTVFMKRRLLKINITEKIILLINRLFKFKNIKENELIDKLIDNLYNKFIDREKNIDKEIMDIELMTQKRVEILDKIIYKLNVRKNIILDECDDTINSLSNSRNKLIEKRKRIFNYREEEMGA